MLFLVSRRRWFIPRETQRFCFDQEPRVVSLFFCLLEEEQKNTILQEWFFLFEKSKQMVCSEETFRKDGAVQEETSKRNTQVLFTEKTLLVSENNHVCFRKPGTTHNYITTWFLVLLLVLAFLQTNPGFWFSEQHQWCCSKQTNPCSLLYSCFLKQKFGVSACLFLLERTILALLLV